MIGGLAKLSAAPYILYMAGSVGGLRVEVAQINKKYDNYKKIGTVKKKEWLTTTCTHKQKVENVY